MTSLLLSLLLAACEGPVHGDSRFYSAWTRLPLDGSVYRWTYGDVDGVQTDLQVDLGEGEQRGGAWVVPLIQSRDGVEIRSTAWSSSPAHGIRIHGFSEAATGLDLVFDPPVQFAGPWPMPGDTLVTETGGATFASTFDQVEGCATIWVPDWEDVACLRYTLDAWGDVDLGGLTGTYWLVPRYGIAIFAPDADGVTWSLAEAEYDHKVY